MADTLHIALSFRQLSAREIPEKKPLKISRGQLSLCLRSLKSRQESSARSQRLMLQVPEMPVISGRKTASELRPAKAWLPADQYTIRGQGQVLSLPAKVSWRGCGEVSGGAVWEIDEEVTTYVRKGCGHLLDIIRKPFLYTGSLQDFRS